LLAASDGAFCGREESWGTIKPGGCRLQRNMIDNIDLIRQIRDRCIILGSFAAIMDPIDEYRF
jgi:hypothetical protein